MHGGAGVLRRAALVVLCSGMLAAPRAAGASLNEVVEETPVYSAGRYMLARYATDGSELHRYTGFSRISALALYDEATVLVGEEERDIVSAVDLHGQVVWTLPVRRPRCIQVLDGHRFLVCRAEPPTVVEIDRTGTVFWELKDQGAEVLGAVRLADGNTAVLAGRRPDYAVRVISPKGEILWSTGARLSHPQGLALLPSGDLAAPAFDAQQVVIFHPYSNDVRSIDFGSNPDVPSSAGDGTVIAPNAERQLLRAWKANGEPAWGFKTFYPAYNAVMLADGTVLASEFRAPDHQCLNAARAARRAKRPLAAYWRWLLAGFVSALLATVFVQRAQLRRFWYPGRRAIAASAHVPPAPAPAVLSGRRRVEVALYVVGATVLWLASALHHWTLLSAGRVQLWPYVGLVSLAGICLALLQWRMPVPDDDWTVRMTRLEEMAKPTWRMWTLWAVAIGLVGIALAGVWQRWGEWVLLPWVAGLVLLAGGAIQEPVHRAPIRARTAISWLFLFGILAAVRVYRLQEYPANLHLDTAQWSLQTFRLLDGDQPTMLQHGYADIPLLGHVWSAIWVGLAGRSLAGTRCPSVAGSLLAIAATMLLVRRLYGSWVAVIATVLLGVNHAFLHFSRIQAYMDPIPFHVLSVLGIVVGLEEGRYGWFALAGLAGGYSALTYHAGRITPLVLGLLGVLLLVRYPGVLRRRWPGLVLCAVTLLSLIGPQVILYVTGRLNAFGRSEVYPFVVNGHVDRQAFLETVIRGLPRVVGAFWFFGDTSTQYGSPWPVFFPASAALLGMAAVAAMLRPRDIRGPWLLAWALVVLTVGGALTINPPFWPRIVTAVVPAVIAAASVMGWLWRGATVAGGRQGRRVGFVCTAAVLGVVSWQHLTFFRNFCHGIRPGRSTPTQATEWVQSIIGRDIQRWGQDAMVFLVASNPIENSCAHATMQYYVDTVDVQDAREIREYLPFKDPRTIVCYFLPDMIDYIAPVRHLYPQAEERVFYNNLGEAVFTRVVVPAPHS